MFYRARYLFSPVDELFAIGSRWLRVQARPANAGNTRDVASSILPPTPFITFIPTLHVASIEFYDAALNYMKEAVERCENVVILLEGVCDNKEGRRQQMEEYIQISQSAELRTAMLEKANNNTLYSEDVIRTICDELAVKYDALRREWESIRLQECYLRPKMAALMGGNLCNDADIDMEEVEALMLEGGDDEATTGSVVSIASIGAHPKVRRRREVKVARKTRSICADWLKRSVKGEVILPWGFYHIDSIRREVLSMDAEDEEVVFSEDDGVLRCVPFGIHKELLV
uniref:Uncharacterized protein n=1 Tax=Trypanosoma congolense (strain IL3000) TaxID=1068625 RepID=G0US84_TRYCI|nr:conserved hypothetical protein [Trypanosoma congolense IL3000]